MPSERRRAEVVAAALALLEEHGPDGVTMRAVAARLGIRAPSLYKHVADKDALELELVAAGLRDLGEHCAAAVDGSSDALHDLAVAYRRWAVRRPHLYRLVTHRPLPRERLPAGLEDAAARPVVEAVGGDPDLARAAWAFAHGMAALEIAGRFPPSADLDAAWAAGTAALSARARTLRPRPEDTR